MSTQSGVLGVYSHMDTLISAIDKFKQSGRNDLRVFSPCPLHQIEDALDEGVSPVRRFTLAGGLLGCVTGYLFTSLASLDWILPTSGKAIISPIAFTVIAFELTILFGSLGTLLGIILNSKLFRKKPTIYDARFTEDKFGIFIPCNSSDYDQVAEALSDSGAEEVQRAE